jgi:uncharacterized OB-fold protein
MGFFSQPFLLPRIGGYAAGYWQAAREHRLAIQRCADCGAWRHPPGPVCWRCRSFRHEYAPVSGRGEILSYTVVHQQLLPELAGVPPYNVIVVALEDARGVHIVSNLVDAPAEDLTVGLPVEVVFEDVSDEITVPRFRRRHFG